MGRVKVCMDYTYVGSHGTAWFIADETEIELLRRSEAARIALIEKWKPELIGKGLRSVNFQKYEKL